MWVDGHHCVHWADGGPAKLDNICSLCRRHHRLVHELGWVVKPLGGGKFQFFTPQGLEIRLPDAPDLGPAPWVTVQEAIESSGVRVDHTSITPRWDGERGDMGLAVQNLCDVTFGTMYPQS